MTTMVQQRSATDCVICCLAMLTGLSWDDVMAAVCDLYRPDEGIRNEHEALKRLGYDSAYENGHPVGDFVVRNRGIFAPEAFRNFAWGRRALLSVPSLNIAGGLHMVYYDGATVFDPSPLKSYNRFEDLNPEIIAVFREVAK